MSYSNNACRLCTQESSRIRPLFNGNEDIISKLKILAPDVKSFAADLATGSRNVTHLPVAAEDGLSSNVCERCVTQLNSSCEFKMLLEATYASIKEKQRQIQDAAFNEVVYIKDEPLPDEEMESVEVNEARESSTNTCSTDLDPLSLKLEDGSCSSVSSSSEALPQTVCCKNCRRKFTTEVGLKAHSSCHMHEERSFCCSYCDKVFNTERGLKIHSVKYHVEGQEYRCTVCSKTFTSDVGLNRHMQSHLEERQHECSICEERFETGIELRLHSRTHANVESQPNSVFTCPVCQKQFGTIKAINTHRRFCTKSPDADSDVQVLNAPASYQCGYCKKEYSKEKAVRTHEAHCRKWQQQQQPQQGLQMNLDVSQFACTLCNQSFNSLTELISHRSVHFNNIATKEEVPAHKFSCGVCKQGFTTCKGLAVHRWRNHHEKETSSRKHNKYSCDVCKQGFTTSKGLAVHRWRNHRGSAATDDTTVYQCTVCKVDFDSARALSMHRWHRHRPNVSQNQAIYTCRLCDKRFSTNKQRIIHNLTFHAFKKKLSADAFTCHVCTQTFGSRTLLLKHKWLMHRTSQQKASTNSTTAADQFFTCTICNQWFASKRLLSKHKWYEHKYKPNKVINPLSKSAGDEKHTCSICNMEFNSARSVAKHKWHRHRQGNQSAAVSAPVNMSFGDHSYYHKGYFCSICDRAFRSSKALGLHNWQAHREQDTQLHKCTLCVRKFTSIRNLETHLLWHKYRETKYPSESKQYSCPKCLSCFEDLATLEAHQNSCEDHRSTPEQPGGVTSSPKTLQPATSDQDAQSNSSERNCISCSLCSKMFASLNSFLLHNSKCHASNDANLMTQSVEQPDSSNFSCNICQKSFRSTHGLVIHNAKVHASNEEEQGTPVPEDEEQQQGVSQVQVENSFHCSVCSKEFATHRNMLIHKKMAHRQGDSDDETSTDLAKERCDQCPRSFKHLRSLLFHKALCHSWSNHTAPQQVEAKDQKPEISADGRHCNLCSRVFRSFHGVLVHYAMTHQKNKPEDESVAEQQKEDIAEVEDVDSQCNVCTKTLKSAHGLLIHMKRAHPTVSPPTPAREMLHHCMLCTRTFISQHALTIHISKFHCKNEQESEEYSEIYRCSECSATFTSLKGLAVHCAKHHGTVQTAIGEDKNILYKCKMCFEVFDKKSVLKTHLEEAHQSNSWETHNSEELEYGCVSCSSNFSSLMDLKRHSSECRRPDVEETKQLHCPICGKESQSFVGLKIHCKRVHQTHWSDLQTSQLVQIDFSDESNTVDQLLKCQACGQLFPDSSGLQLHYETAHAAADMSSVPNVDISLSKSLAQ